MRLLTGLAGLLLLSGCGDIVAGEERQFADYSLISADISKSNSFTLYEGLPSDFDFPDEYEFEKNNRKTVEFQKNLFYVTPITVRPPDIENLKQIFADKSTFVPYGGPKACGGFHADFDLEWKTPSGPIHTLICFTCHEMASELKGKKVLCDISNTGYAKLRKVLDQYKVNVPTGTYEGMSFMKSSLVAAQSASVYRGLPRGVKPSAESILLNGHDFYKKPQSLSAEDKKKLQEFFGKSGMIRAHEPKKCTFHPDFAIEWTSDDSVHRWLICFGCSEMKYLVQDVEEETYYDLTEAGADFLNSILARY